MTSLTLVFAGSPSAAVPSLRRLASSGHSVAAVVTREDSPQGRRGVVTPTPVAAEAASLGLPVIRSNRLDATATERIAAVEPDLGVIVAYGGLVREPLLSVPKHGWINLHFSLLPRWRGAAPVQHAILAGDELSGASVFQLVPGLDEGDVFATMTQPIGAHQTSGGLLESLSESGAALLARVVDLIASGEGRAEAQVGDVTLAPKLSLADGALDWSRPGVEVYNRFRAVTPEPGAFTTVDGARLKVLEAAPVRDAARLDPGRIELVGKRLLIGTASEPIELVTVLPAGKRAMDALAWWRGRPASAATVAS